MAKKAFETELLAKELNIKIIIKSYNNYGNKCLRPKTKPIRTRR